jgi:hypothetical protein
MGEYTLAGGGSLLYGRASVDSHSPYSIITSGRVPEIIPNVEQLLHGMKCLISVLTPAQKKKFTKLYMEKT